MTENNSTLLEHQMELERLYNKNQLIPRIREEFLNESAGSFVDYIQSKGIPINFGIDLLVQMALHKRTTLPVLVGLLNKHFNDAQTTADMLLKAAEADLVDWNPAYKQFIVRFTISDDVQDEIDKYQFPLPMVVEPRELKKNTDSGYYLTKSSVILKNNHHNEDVCLDHLNRMNSIKFTINTDTTTMIKNKWRNLDKAKPGESRADYQKRVKAFNKYNRTAHDVIAQITQHGNVFHLTHKYDKRGRVYSQGYHINYQGNTWNKSVIELANKETVDG